MRNRVLCICPCELDTRELARCTSDVEVVLYPVDVEPFRRQMSGGKSVACDISSLLDTLITAAKKSNVHGICSTRDYPGNILACVVADMLHLPGPSPKAVMTCHHKYISRLQQRKVDPSIVPWFQLLDVSQSDMYSVKLPCFVKPIKSLLSMGARTCYERIILDKETVHRSQMFTAPLLWAMEQYGLEIPKGFFIAEEMLKGKQVTFEGYVHDHVITKLGIVDSLMYPESPLAFRAFTYPSRLSQRMQHMVDDISVRLIRDLGLNNSLFNIEYMINEESEQIKVIEINPRMAAQFADLYVKVDGASSYDILLALSIGRKPRICNNKGSYSVAGTYVLRTFQDYFVKKVPKQKDIDRITCMYPDAQCDIMVQKGKRLSDYVQDTVSFRYAAIQLGATTFQDLESAFESCKQLLPFSFV